MNLSSSRPVSRLRAELAPRLCVVFGCHDLVCALPIATLDRLTLPESAEELDPPAAPAGGRADGPLPDVVEVDEQRFAAWDLGVLFGLGPVAGAWVLLRLSHAGTEIPLALRTGPCFAVQELHNLMKIPGELFQSRGGAVVEGFATAAVKRARFETGVGLVLDPGALLLPQELEASAKALRRHAR